MDKLDYTHDFQTGVKVIVNGELFDQSFGNKESVEDILKLYHIGEGIESKTIGINGTGHSNKVTTVNAEKVNKF